MEGSEAARLLGERSLEPPARFRTYRRRWFLLAVVCLLNCSNAMVSAARDAPRGAGKAAGARAAEQGRAQPAPPGSASRELQWCAIELLWLLLLLLRREDELTRLAGAKTTSCFFLEAARRSPGLLPQCPVSDPPPHPRGTATRLYVHSSEKRQPGRVSRTEKAAFTFQPCRSGYDLGFRAFLSGRWDPGHRGAAAGEGQDGPGGCV